MAKPQDNAVAVRETASLPVGCEDFLAGTTGFENAGREDYAIPFLKILQPTSAECKEGESAFIEDARPGMFYDTVNQQVYAGKTGVTFIPCYYRRFGTLWVPLNEGGGFRGIVPLSELDAALSQCNEHYITPEGLQLNDTREWYGLLLNEDGSTTPVLLSLTSTQIKKSKKWLALAGGIKINGQQLKLWAQTYKLTTALEKNDQGSWYGIEFKYTGPVPSKEVFDAAQSFRDIIEQSAAQANYETVAPPVDDDVPFEGQF